VVISESPLSLGLDAGLDVPFGSALRLERSILLTIQKYDPARTYFLNFDGNALIEFGHIESPLSLTYLLELHVSYRQRVQRLLESSPCVSVLRDNYATSIKDANLSIIRHDEFQIVPLALPFEGWSGKWLEVSDRLGHRLSPLSKGSRIPLSNGQTAQGVSLGQM